MNELIVVGFKDRYRAAHLFCELWRSGNGWIEPEHAVTVVWKSPDDLLVQLFVNLGAGSGEGWGRLWGAFISATLLSPFGGEVGGAARAVTDASNGLTAGPLAEGAKSPGGKWWLEEVGIPGDFIRDVGALVRPGDSAVFTITKVSDLQAVSEQAHDSGGALLHTSLNPDQMRCVQHMLATPPGERQGAAEDTSPNEARPLC